MLALVAMGLSLVFGVMNVSQFAHGEFFMIGTLASYLLYTPIKARLGSNPSPFMEFITPFLVIIAAMLVGAVVGALTYETVFHPLRRRSRENWVMNTFLLTVGLSVILINAHQLLFGTEFKGIVNYWTGAPIEVLGTLISKDRLMTMIIALIIVIGFSVFMQYTQIGRAIRAVSQDETGALLLGINLDGILLLTMSLSSALAALAGASLLYMYPSYPTVGLEPLYMAWFVVILVGMGNTYGAIVGGFIVALLKTITVEYIGAGWDFVLPSALICLVLIFKPSGIFGSEVRGIMEQ
ncbi:MAG: branched-chain amino acid ABC transporter permease [Deltaproteobacteria bacterium]|nr:branched-chain amino acid ABC transporter permease [Deltaproteobacteria bacterium]